ncbi:MAG: hypothetical protein LUE13_06130 [Akkermansiaceae bacterium]|nr:hypothetical protein [Akkermansiaceae bacterium]
MFIYRDGKFFVRPYFADKKNKLRNLSIRKGIIENGWYIPEFGDFLVLARLRKNGKRPFDGEINPSTKFLASLPEQANLPASQIPSRCFVKYGQIKARVRKRIEKALKNFDYEDLKRVASLMEIASKYLYLEEPPEQKIPEQLCRFSKIMEDLLSKNLCLPDPKEVREEWIKRFDEEISDENDKADIRALGESKKSSKRMNEILERWGFEWLREPIDDYFE